MRARWIAALIPLMGCAIAPPPPAEVTAFQPEPALQMDAPAGPAVLLGRGDNWEVVAYRSGLGELCLHARHDTGSTGGCGERVGEGDIVGPIGILTSEMATETIVYSLLDADVRDVRIEADGKEFDADLYTLTSIGFEFTGFATALPAGLESLSIVAIDSTGGVLERAEVPREP